MRQIALLFVMLGIAGACFSAEGFVVLKTGDTIRGKVQFKWSGLKGASVTVKNPEGKKAYKASEVASYTRKGKKMMLFKTVHSRKDKHIDPLEVVEDGQVKMLLQYCRYSRYSYDTYILLEDGRLVFVWEDSYNNTLLHHFNQSPAFRAQVAKTLLPYSKKRKGYIDRIRALVQLYNKR